MYSGDKDPVNASFGQIVRRYREGRKYTQEEFAEMCGISRAYYGRIERGEWNVTLKMCHQIAEALGVRLFDLFEDMPE